MAKSRTSEVSPEEREEYLAKQKTLKGELQRLEEKERQLKADMEVQHLLIPNIPDDDVPEGKDDEFNVEVRTFGEPPQRDFEVRPHYRD